MPANLILAEAAFDDAEHGANAHGFTAHRAARLIGDVPAHQIHMRPRLGAVDEFSQEKRRRDGAAVAAAAYVYHRYRRTAKRSEELEAIRSLLAGDSAASLDDAAVAIKGAGDGTFLAVWRMDWTAETSGTEVPVVFEVSDTVFTTDLNWTVTID